MTTDVTESNLLIQGDSTNILEQLNTSFSKTLKCIYMDPPYNTQNIFEHYHDAQNHDTWLQFMKKILLECHKLLRDDGLLFVQIDDRELAYLQVLLDSIFGRENRVNLITVKMSEVSGVKMTHVNKRLPKIKEFILVYSKTSNYSIQPIRKQKTPEQLLRYLRYYTKIIENPDDPVENWVITPVKDYMKNKGFSIEDEDIKQFQIQEKHRVVYRTNNQHLEKVSYPTKTALHVSSTGISYIWWEAKQMLFLKDYCEEYYGDLWTDISTINLNKEGGVSFKNGKKPETLLQRILEISTKEGDWVLDPFAGSGTTAVVAQKMNRKWLTIEQGQQIETHCLFRLKELLEHRSKGGIDASQMSANRGFIFLKEKS